LTIPPIFFLFLWFFAGRFSLMFFSLLYLWHLRTMLLVAFVFGCNEHVIVLSGAPLFNFHLDLLWSGVLVQSPFPRYFFWRFLSDIRSPPPPIPPTHLEFSPWKKTEAFFLGPPPSCLSILASATQSTVCIGPGPGFGYVHPPPYYPSFCGPPLFAWEPSSDVLPISFVTSPFWSLSHEIALGTPSPGVLV